MSIRGETLARAVESCKNLTGRYLAGFTDQTAVAQPPGLPNHVAWSLGHMALTMHRVAEKLDGAPTPATDFGVDTGAFNPESVSFGSTPAADASGYPNLARCAAIYDAACDRLAELLRAAPDAKLEERFKWGPMDMTLEALSARMIFHNGMHTGQIADLRRALGMKSIFS